MRRRLVPFLFLLGSACRDDDGGEALSHQIDDTRAHVDALREEVAAHAAAAEQAADLAALRSLEQPHDAEAAEHMDMLGHAIDDMGMCDDVPVDDLAAMMDMRDACSDELDRHEQAIADAASLDAARNEETRHMDAMMDSLDDLDTMAGSMMESHGTTMCMDHHGMDDHPD